MIAVQVWCQVLALIKLYLSSASYWWMLCEGVYLHRLLVNAFHPPKSLAIFCVLGWGEYNCTFTYTETACFHLPRVKCYGDFETIIYH